LGIYWRKLSKEVMLNETRVNLKHLLEDIRDAYTSPLEEVILTELVANALDGKAVTINFTVDKEQKFIRCTDDGKGMKRAALKDYHNIASSTKTRGQGIGFAGVGAKLSLLIADRVVTESKGGYGTKAATEWRLTNPYRAPWKFIPFSGTVTTPRGTSVTIYFNDDQSHLVKPEFVRQTIIKHFYPLLSVKFYNDSLPNQTTGSTSVT
jgi:HSP90 family molecular chaperone